MKVTQTKLNDCVIIEPKVFGDDRGFFTEVFHKEKFAAAGLPDVFVQDNHSRSQQGVLRGLHFQYPLWQGKLVRVVIGSIFDVAVDIRPDSPTYGEWLGIELSADNGKQLYIPEGFAHGFCSLTDADVTYKCTNVYKKEDDTGILWNDPDIGVEWPISSAIVSEKDKNAIRFRDLVFG